MNTSEANALNTFTRWALNLPRAIDSKARTDAMWLMERARMALGAGLGAGDVAEHWPSGDLRERYGRLNAQLAFIDQAVNAWQDGADPGDTLRAIRDQLTGKAPGEEER